MQWFLVPLVFIGKHAKPGNYWTTGCGEEVMTVQAT